MSCANECMGGVGRASVTLLISLIWFKVDFGPFGLSPNLFLRFAVSSTGRFSKHNAAIYIPHGTGIIMPVQRPYVGHISHKRARCWSQAKVEGLCELWTSKLLLVIALLLQKPLRVIVMAQWSSCRFTFRRLYYRPTSSSCLFSLGDDTTYVCYGPITNLAGV